MKINPWFLVIFFGSILSWLFLFFTNRFSGHATGFITWVLEKGTFDWFAFPIMRVLGEQGYSLVGYSFFFIFPFAMFSLSILFILFLALEFGYCNKWLALCLLVTGYGLGEIGFFTHDAPMFFLVCVYAFFYFRFLYKQKGYFITLLGLNVAMLFCRESGLVLLPFTFLALFQPRVLRWPDLSNGDGMCYSLIPSGLLSPTFTSPDLLGKTIYDLNAAFMDGFDALVSFHPGAWFKYFQHPIFCLSFFALFYKKDFHLLVLTCLTFLYVLSINSSEIFYTSVLRYSLAFVPLHLFYILSRGKTI